MGWISKRCHMTGCSIGGRHGKHKGPLRKITGVIVAGSHEMFGSDLVVMECGHEGLSYGGKRARCRECGNTDPKFAAAAGRKE